MNQNRLDTIFQNYIAKFDYLNRDKEKTDPDEKYKWEIAFRFKPEMDEALNAPDEAFYDKLSPVLTKLADNLLQNQYELPGAALCDYIKQGESPTVRSLLFTLFSDDKGDLALRQKNIDAFILGCNTLKEKYFPGSFKYEMNQRAAMVLRGLYYPELDYIYKASEASDFADFVEYYDSFGTYNHFKMPAYYRMCDQLVEAMRHNEPLMEKHKNRCTLSTQPLHPDANLHLLAFDVIYCSYHYYLTAGTSYARITGAERKRYLEKQAKAKELASQLDQAQQDIQLYQEAAQYYGSLFTSGMPVCHRLFGEGTVVFLKDSALGRRTVEVVFLKANRTMQFDTVTLILSGLMQLPSVKQDELKEKAALYRAVIQKGEASLISALKSAEKAFLPYREYLA